MKMDTTPTKIASEARKEQNKAAQDLKRQQDKARAKFEYLLEVDKQHFAHEYVKAQAKEICAYLNFCSLTPLNAWYSKLRDTVVNDDFMYSFYLTLNEYGQLEPDYERIDKLILPDPLTADEHSSMTRPEFLG
jgi:hypothetical protein